MATAKESATEITQEVTPKAAAKPALTVPWIAINYRADLDARQIAQGDNPFAIGTPRTARAPMKRSVVYQGPSQPGMPLVVQEYSLNVGVNLGSIEIVTDTEVLTPIPRFHWEKIAINPSVQKLIDAGVYVVIEPDNITPENQNHAPGYHHFSQKLAIQLIEATYGESWIQMGMKFERREAVLNAAKLRTDEINAKIEALKNANAQSIA